MTPLEPPAPDAGSGRSSRWLLALILLAALFVRLWPVHHGHGQSYVPDTHMVRGALGMAQDRNPVPPAGVYSTYPNLMPYCLLPIYAGEYALGRLTGEWGGVGDFKLRVALEPARVFLPARILVALFGALTAWVVYRATRAAGLGRGALVAAWLVATALLHTQFSVQERPWVPLVFFTALAAWPAALYVRHGRLRHLLASGAAAALAFSCHQAGLPSLGIAGLAWWLGPQGWRGSELVVRLKWGVLCVGLFALLSLVVGHPYYLVHGPPAAQTVAGGATLGAADGPSVTIGGQGMIFEFRAASLGRLSRALLGYEPALLGLGLLGLYAALRRRAMLPAVIFGLGWAALFMTNRNDHVRYLLPVVVLLAWPAGAAAELLLERRWGRVLLVPLLLLPLVQNLRLGHVLRQVDTRNEAALLFEYELESGARVAVDRFGPRLDLNAAALERLAGWRALTTREEVRAEILAAGPEAREAWGLGPGLDAVPLEEVFAYEDRTASAVPRAKPAAELGLAPGADFGAALRALGATHAVRVQRGGSRPDPLGAWLDAEGPAAVPVWLESPGEGAPAGTEFLLPLELDFALTDIWRVERPGPRLVLYRLP